MCGWPEGIGDHELVTYYEGELYPPWLWSERQEALEVAQRKYQCKPTLPDFYNMTMERPLDDEQGYGVLYIDASKRANLASRMSHSCAPNCATSVVAVDGRIAVAVHTVRSIREGEELTIDYNAATDSEVEMRAAVCLCGSVQCRGAFLDFTGSEVMNQVKQVIQQVINMS